MATDLWATIRELDPAATAKAIDGTAIARRLASLPRAEADAWIASVESAATSGVPHAALADFSDVKERMRLILTLRDQPTQRQRANDLIEETLVEWSIRRPFEAWSGLAVGSGDPAWEAELEAKLKTLKVGSPAEVKFTAARLAVWNDVLGRSRVKGDATRKTKLAHLKGPKAEYRFYNPCRPIEVAVTKYPQRDVAPKHPSDAWRNPVRVIDAHEGTRADKAPILLLHGHGSLAEEYEELIDALRTLPATRDVRILVPDLPGYGYSDASKLGELSTAGYVAFLQQLVTQLGLSRFVPAGGSLGGNLTMQLLAEKDARIPTGIAWSVVSWCEPSPQMEYYAKWARVGRELGGEIFWATYNVQKGEWFPHWTPKKVEQALRDSDVYRREVFSKEYCRATFDLVIDQCENLQLHKAPLIEKPVLMLAGKHDHNLGVYPSMVALQQKLAARLGPDKCVLFDGFKYGDHSVASEEPALVARKLADWYGRYA